MFDRGTVGVDLAHTFRSTALARVDAQYRDVPAAGGHDVGQRAEALAEVDADFHEPAAVGEMRDRLGLQVPPLEPAGNVLPSGHRCVEIRVRHAPRVPRAEASNY